LVSSYNKNPMAVNEPDGIACVWNLHMPERPEFVFHSQVGFFFGFTLASANDLITQRLS
jgi:hypothetical protein